MQNTTVWAGTAADAALQAFFSAHGFIGEWFLRWRAVSLQGAENAIPLASPLTLQVRRPLNKLSETQVDCHSGSFLASE